MIWLPQEDVFSFAIDFRKDLDRLLGGDIYPTKRELLSLVMSIFDPLGLAANYIIHGKMLVQDVWRTNTAWDEKIPDEIFPTWQRWVQSLRELTQFRIDRCYFPGYTPKALETLELHVFVDASVSAYAAVAYFRIVDRATVRCSLVSSKTKVAPIKQLSVPRLELQAAVLGTRLTKSIISSHTLSINRKVFWSDSNTVLAWLRSDQRRFHQFVAFKIGEIQEETDVSEWRKVPSGWNVADDATKWGWSESFEQQQMVGYVLRFRSNLQKRLRKQQLPGTISLSSEELLEAERTIIRSLQREVFSEEYAILDSKQQSENDEPKTVKKTSKIYKLCPFVGVDGVLRKDGRIGAAPWLTIEAKFPAILPKAHYVTALVVDEIHRKFGHSNNETVVNEVRQRYHVSELRAVVRRVAQRCQRCKMRKATPLPPRMSSLPEVRLTPYVKPFTYTGLDYFGPLSVRIGRSHAKRWVALFTCLTTRAVHLELAYTLSTESCKMAVRRFVARRGAPMEIYSDQGTNFQGARKELNEQVRRINCELSSTFTNAITKWKLNPPYAPHMGGIWERLVRSVKCGLAAMEISRNADEETLLTALAEVESMVNTRPLTYLPLDAAEDETLTPNHFLLLSSNGVCQPAAAPQDERSALRSNWNHVRVMLDRFWKRWIREYIPVIAKQSKWFGEVKPLKVGDLVVSVNENVRNSWDRGVVIIVYPGKDGRIIRADVRTAAGVFLRPVTQLAVLDVLDKGGIAEETTSNTGWGMCATVEDPSSPVITRSSRSTVTMTDKNDVM
ncbi:uncharacterized protein LOC134288715 [Aedes albopictus]|uniref:Integrase catalytic domain-containing protein n=1 Tax=Aedes albopictus TaxID=7160 RepID=A0ABM2A3F0_AEDAL